MNSILHALQRVWAFLRKKELDTDLESEMAAHIELAVEENRRNGMTPDEARRQAMLRFGSLDSAKELHRDTRGLPFLDKFQQDLKFTVRTLRRDAGFTTFALLIIGLGIGSTATIFSVVNALLLRPLDFKASDRLVWAPNSGGEGLSAATVQVNNFRDFRDQNKSFEEMAAYFAFYGVGDSKLSGHGEPERLSGVPVSQNFFSLLGVKPLMGRMFNDQECQWHGPKATLITHGLWKRRFAQSPSIVGTKIILDDEPYQIIGVLPETFDFATVFAPGAHIDLFFAFPLTEETNRWGNTLSVIGRLKPGVSLAAAQSEATTIGKRLEALRPNSNSYHPQLSMMKDYVSARIRPALIVLSCAVFVVMLIVCANLSNLLLARMAARQKEVAVRVALGAGRGRLIRQMLTESITLSSIGAVLGLLLCWIATRTLASIDTFNIPLLSTVHMDLRAVLFTAFAALVTGVLFGLMPAVHLPSSVHDTLKDGTRGSTEGRHHNWIRSTLVVSEIAFACVLLVGAGLLVRSFIRLLDVDLGFRPQNVAAIRIDPSRQYDTREKQNAYFDEALRTVRSQPGIEAASLTDTLPFGRNRTWLMRPRGFVLDPDNLPLTFVRVVGDGYLKTMGIPLIEGRDFTELDAAKSDGVAIINEAAARRFWPNGGAMGSVLLGFGGSDRRIVGIAKNVRHLALEKDSGLEIYIPMRQTGDRMSVDLVVRTALPPATLASTVRAALTPIEPNLPANEFRTVQGLLDRSVSPRRFVVLLLTGFSAFALILASLGIYGLISYSVSQRTQEIGIRMALGATAADLRSRIVSDTLRLAGIGIVIGLVVSWVAAQAISGLLFGVAPSDPVTFGVMVVVLISVATLAGYLPARRASRIDPMVALRAS